MKTSAIAILAGTMLIASPAFAADDASKPLQGVWSGTRYGEGKGEDPSKGVALELTITGTHVAGKRVSKGAIGEGDIKLAAGGKIDATGTTGGFKGKTIPGIFKIEGDKLLWCVTTSGSEANRPTDFVAEPAKQSWLMVLKKQ
ncbi:MAG: TIGR03067 domain-containing protein [Verrucomicrobia bacterium]|nr:TIGR03067 domain-containing protein [Verrucomicrobiota bacterium]